MDSVLKGLFGGGDDDRTPQAQDFVNRFEQGPIDQGYSDQEAAQHYQTVSQNVDPETMQRAAEQTFARMDPNQRAELSQMLQQRMGGQQGGGSNDPRQMAGMVSQMHRQDPGGLSSLFGGGNDGGGGGIGGMLGGLLGGGSNDRSGNSGGGGFPGGTLGKVAMGGIAAYAMKEILGGGGGGGNDKKQHRSV